MGFREALRTHLRAIQERDLDALAATLAGDELVLIMADGTLKRGAQAFLEAHRGWFAVKDWTLQTEEVVLFESPELAVALLRLDYREPPATRSRSYLTLVFQRKGERWLMVQDQNTPIK